MVIMRFFYTVLLTKQSRQFLFSYCCLLIIICLLLLSGGCKRTVEASGTEISTPVPVASIQVYPTEVSLAAGQKLQLFATLGDAAGNMLPHRKKGASYIVGSEIKTMTVMADTKGRAGRSVSWSSSHPDLVSVDAQGLVTAHAIGMAEITAVSEQCSKTVAVHVVESKHRGISISPLSGGLMVGEKLPLVASLASDKKNLPIAWKTDQPARATVSQDGVVSALAPGKVLVQASHGEQKAEVRLVITPQEQISGLDFPGNAGVNTTLRFEFAVPLAAFPATYIWRAYPRQQQSYYSSFFWGNNGPFHPSNTYYGFHPYPDWNTEQQQFWEVAAPPGGDHLSLRHVVYDRWYVQVAICREVGDTAVYEFFWDWPDQSKVIRYTGKRYANPPAPVLVVGDAPWNQGNEVWNGVLRGFQFYDSAMTLDEITKEISLPASVRKPWYLNLNPTPDDISDKSGNGHHPVWVGYERPVLWKAMVNADGNKIIRSPIPACYE